MTKAEKARAGRSCPKCHAKRGRPCMKNQRRIGNTTVTMPGSPMTGVHAERLAPLPGAST